MQLATGPDPSPKPTGDTASVSFTTVSGVSNTKAFTYAPIQVVTSVSTEVLPSSGGTTLTIHGGGFKGTSEIVFSDTNGNDPPVFVLSNFKIVSAAELTVTSPSMVPGAYQVVVCGQFTCGANAGASAAGDVVAVIFPGATAVTSDTTDPASANQPSGPTAGGTVFEVQGTNFGPIGHLTAEFVNALGETVTSTSIAAGPAATDPGATQSVLVTTPAALGGYPDLVAVVLVGDNGASSETPTALFTYS